jgi:flagellar biosynthesis protein FliR
VTYKLVFADLYQYFIVFARVGTAFMFLPGFGEHYVPARIRLLIAFGVALVITGVVGHTIPPFTEQMFGLEHLLIREVLIGLFIGVLARMLLYTLDVAATVFGYQMGLGNAALFNPMVGGQTPFTGVFLMTAAVTLIFVTETHHRIIAGLVSTYDVISPSQEIIWKDFTFTLVHALDRVFWVAFQLSTPFLLIGLVFQIGLGLLNRLMPQMQVFFVALPLQIILGLGLMMITGGMILHIFIEGYPTYFETYLGIR